jgi:hypothetical protein
MIKQTKTLLLKFPVVRKLIKKVIGVPQPAEHRVKQATIRDLSEKYETRIFVETGTYRGDMLEAMKNRFEKLYSIELNHDSYLAAKTRFAQDLHVEILHGDSGEKLKEIMPVLSGPALFWLDGHYSGGETSKGPLDTPIMAELDHILSAPDLGHVIVIDDARLFGRDPSYPTIEAVVETVRRRRPGLHFVVANDSIRFMNS